MSHKTVTKSHQALKQGHCAGWPASHLSEQSGRRSTLCDRRSFWLSAPELARSRRRPACARKIPGRR